jgi:PhnB protein
LPHRRRLPDIDDVNDFQPGQGDTMLVQPYLMFDGRCEEAIEFSRRAVGAETTMLMRFKDSPEPPKEGCGGTGPAAENKVMHASVTIGNSTIGCTDGQAQGKEKFSGMSLSLAAANDAEAQKAFAALGAGGNVFMPLAKTFFSSSFGMVQDKFGVVWMVLVAP